MMVAFNEWPPSAKKSSSMLHLVIDSPQEFDIAIRLPPGQITGFVELLSPTARGRFLKKLPPGPPQKLFIKGGPCSSVFVRG
jgi:hypothetical protein